MSVPTRKHLTKSKALLRREIVSKLDRLTNKEDLIVLNSVIDKYLPQEAESVTPEEAFGEDWTDKSRRLGKLIRGFRFREGWNQNELARQLRGVKQSNISAWENAKEQVPEKRLKQLSKLFKTDLEKLIK